MQTNAPKNRGIFYLRYQIWLGVSLALGTPYLLTSYLLRSN